MLHQLLVLRLVYDAGSRGQAAGVGAMRTAIIAIGESMQSECCEFVSQV